MKSWLDLRLARDPGTKVYFSYFGLGSPASYGISPPPRGYITPYGTGGLDYRGLAAEPLEFERRALVGLPLELGAGVYCVSATNLQGVYYSLPGRWSAERERAWNELRRPAGAGGRLPSPAVRHLQFETGVTDTNRLLDLLGTARLMAFLRGREPDAEIGYSILCFELSAADINQAFAGPAPEVALAATTAK